MSSIDRLKNKIITGDFLKLEKSIPDESVDIIFTDPPYIFEYVYLYFYLSKVASRILKPGGYLLAYVGNFHLDKMLSFLGDYLSFYQLLFLKVDGAHARVLNTFVRIKPVAFFYKDKIDYSFVPWHPNLYQNNIQEKEAFGWQQGINFPLWFLRTFAKKDNLILDPFAGSGTTLVACKKLGLDYLGYEVESDRVKMCERRLAQEVINFEESQSSSQESIHLPKI